MQLRFPHEYEAMLRAVQLGEQDRQVVVHVGQSGCIGNSNGCRHTCRSQGAMVGHVDHDGSCPTHGPFPVTSLCRQRGQGGVPIRSMSLARCDRITDAAVAELCDTFTSLQRVDLTRCVEVGDAAMARLAAYTRQLEDGDSAAGGSSGDEEEEAEDEWQAQAAAEAVGSMQLASGTSPPPPAAGAVTGGKAFESPDSAVRRIAAQRHAAMMARSARQGALVGVGHLMHISACCRVHGRHCAQWNALPHPAFCPLLRHPVQRVHSMGGHGTWACMSWC